MTYAARNTSFSTWPSRMKIVRYACAATSASCVTRMIVFPASCKPLEQVHDFNTRLRVEVAGRLVSQEDRRVVHERAGNGHALSLPARQLIGTMHFAIAEIDFVQGVFGPLVLPSWTRLRRSRGSSTL